MTLQPSSSVEAANLADPDFWLGDTVHNDLARLRRENPISWHEHPESGRGMWSVVRHDDICEITRDVETFVNRHGVRPHHDADSPGLIQPGTGVMQTMDPPNHTVNRKFVSPSFTVRRINQMTEYVRTRASAIVEELPEHGTIDFVEEVAARLPMEIICDVLDIPAADRAHLQHLTNLALGDQDPTYGATPAEGAQATRAMREYGLALGLERRRQPGDDLLSIVAAQRPDGSALTDEQLAAMFGLVVAAGNETTRTAISHGMLALSEFPDQRVRWMADPEGLERLAAEEIIRWATPVRCIRRTVSRDIEYRGVPMRKGDKVVLWFASGNRDEDAFEDPDTFNLARDPNPSLSFGAAGPHFCLGANLARREVSVLFQALFSRFPEAHVVGRPTMLRSVLVNGVKSMRVEL